MYTPETRILFGNEAQKRGRTRIRNRLIGVVLAAAVGGSGWWAFKEAQTAHIEHQQKIDQAVANRKLTIEGLIMAPYSSGRLVQPENKPEATGCKREGSACQVSAHATYEASDIHGLTAEFDAKLDAKGLRAYSGAIGTQNSLKDTNDQTAFVLEYGRPNGTKESIDGTHFSWHAILDCRVSGLNGVPTSEAAVDPNAGVCSLEITWMREIDHQGANQ
jgi:hypothetical protein